MPANIRVRGIHATAISKLLLDHGYAIVQPSEKICRRLGLERDNSPPHATIKSSSEGNIVVIGEPRVVEEVKALLVDTLKHVTVWSAKPNLHSVILGQVKEITERGALVEIGDGLTGLLPELGLRPGQKILVCVEKPVMKDVRTPLLSRRLRVIGMYATLVHGGRKVVLSRHITDRGKREELLALGMALNTGDWGIKWRSSARFVELTVLAGEVQELREKAEQLLRDAERCEPITVLSEGQGLVEIGLTRPARRVLDELRGSVIPTLPGHHALKAVGAQTSMIVDYAEKVMERLNLDPRLMAEATTSYIADLLAERHSIPIRHVRARDGRVIELTPGRLVDMEQDGEDLRITLKRLMRGRGVYDGLGAKKEPGDYDLMRLSTRSWIIVHEYHGRDGNVKGYYINLNTPPEVTPEGVIYVDLHVDIVVNLNEGNLRVVDEDELNELHEAGILTDTTYNTVRSIIKRCIDTISSEGVDPYKLLTLGEGPENISSQKLSKTTCSRLK